MKHRAQASAPETAVRLSSDGVELEGDVAVPAGAEGLVLFAHGSGSSRHSPRNQFVARMLREAGLGTLLFDLLTADEEEVDVRTAHLRFDIGLLARRLIGATRWVECQDEISHLRVGYFGSSTGGAAALVAAAERGDAIGAVVSRGGRPDLAANALARVVSPTLLIVGGEDDVVIELNEQAFSQIHCEKAMRIIPGATHLFSEPGALEQVADLAAEWFRAYLRPIGGKKP
jgi:dienelactone hydrolase